MDLSSYVDSVKRYTAELVRRNAEAQDRARADLPRLVEFYGEVLYAQS